MFPVRFSILLQHSVLVFLTLLAISSCKLKPLYANPNLKKGEVCNNFNVEIDDDSVLTQKFKFRLSDLLNQTCVNTDDKFDVAVKVEIIKQGLGIQIDREITRFNMLMNTKYSVSSENQRKVIYAAKSRVTGAFDAQVSDYATYAIEQDTVNKLGEELAREIALKITTKINQLNEEK